MTRSDQLDLEAVERGKIVQRLEVGRFRAAIAFQAIVQTSVEASRRHPKPTKLSASTRASIGRILSTTPPSDLDDVGFCGRDAFGFGTHGLQCPCRHLQFSIYGIVVLIGIVVK